MGGAVRHCPHPHPRLPLLLRRASVSLGLALPTLSAGDFFCCFLSQSITFLKCQDKNVPGHFPSLFNESAAHQYLQMADKHSQMDTVHSLLNLSTCITLIC